VSDLAPEALAGLLREAVGEDPRRPFSGSVTDGAFVITRLREYRSTFMPVLRGLLAPGPDGSSRVRLRLRPPSVVIIFMTVWLGFLAAVAATILAGRAFGGTRSLLWLLAPAGVAVRSWRLMCSVFAADARWAVEHLLEKLPALRPDRAPL
jgi:hypothetical protein